MYLLIPVGIIGCVDSLMWLIVTLLMNTHNFCFEQKNGDVPYDINSQWFEHNKVLMNNSVKEFVVHIAFVRNIFLANNIVFIRLKRQLQLKSSAFVVC